MNDDQLIHHNLASYEYEDEDRKLASKISGLKFSHTVNPKPFAPVFHFEINQNSQLTNISLFLATIPKEFEIDYFRPFNPGKSSAGVRTIVQQHGKNYCFYSYGHAGDELWKTITKEQLLNELFTFRERQSFGTIKVSRIRKRAILGEKAYSFA